MEKLDMPKNKLALLLWIIIILLFLYVITSGISNGIKISKLNNMYKDIKSLEEKISLYYLNTGNIPMVEDYKIENFSDKSINPNDNDNYYEIDLEKLENLQLSYGDGNLGQKDKYIINEQSHTIYYYEGIEYKGKVFYTRDINYYNVELENFQ